MATSKLNLDLNAWFEAAKAQFSGLDFNEPGQWPIIPKVFTYVVVGLVVLFLGWMLILSSQSEELEGARNSEVTLRQEFVDKAVQANNLEQLKNQRLQVQEYVLQLEKQLPGKAEIDALLSDINQAGIGRGLDFDLFKPGEVVLRDYYVELPIEIKVSGSYHDMAAFAADVSNLSRIVTLQDIGISVEGNTRESKGPLFMQATARTYRYLDENEIQIQQAEKNKKQQEGKS